jgi:hypothetical protein
MKVKIFGEEKSLMQYREKLIGVADGGVKMKKQIVVISGQLASQKQRRSALAA